MEQFCSQDKRSGRRSPPQLKEMIRNAKTVQHLEGGIVDKIPYMSREEQGGKGTAARLTLKSASRWIRRWIWRKNPMFCFSPLKNRYMEAEKALSSDCVWDGETLLELCQIFTAMRMSFESGRIIFARPNQSSYTRGSQTRLLDTQNKADNRANPRGAGRSNAEKNHYFHALQKNFCGQKEHWSQKDSSEKSRVLELERRLATHEERTASSRQTVAASEQKNGCSCRKTYQHYRAGRDEMTNTWMAKSCQTKGTASAAIAAIHDQAWNSRSCWRAHCRPSRYISPGGVIQPGQAFDGCKAGRLSIAAEAHIPVDKITEVYVGQWAQAQSWRLWERNTTPMIPAERCCI